MSAERVLVVDDNEDVRRILGMRLSAAGFSVAGAADGREALAAMRAGRWDLVLLDLVMPELDGFQVLASLQECPEPRPPVVVITQYDELANRQRALELGAARYVGKAVALDRSFPSDLREWVEELRRSALRPG